MNPEQLRALLARVAENLSNQALVTELLTQVGDAFEATHTSQQALQVKGQEYEEQVKKLQETNMNLFLRVQTPAPINPEKVEGDKPLLYDDLLKDFGV